MGQYFKMMVLLLYIQNQDKQKMTKKNQIKFPEKKYPNPATTQNNPKNPSKTTKNFATHHNFFLQVMNKILKRNNVFVFDPEVPKKKTTTKLQNPRKHKKQANKKKEIPNPATTQNNPKNPSTTKNKNLPHTTIFFLQVM